MRMFGKERARVIMCLWYVTLVETNKAQFSLQTQTGSRLQMTETESHEPPAITS